MLLFSLFVIFSCSKKEEIKFDDVNQLIGKWLLVSECGGFSGMCSYPTASERLTVEFTNNGKYIESRNDTLIQESDFNITETASTPSAIYYLTLDTSYTYGIQLINNNLSIFKGDIILTYKRK
jgi:hypothetical protein